VLGVIEMASRARDDTIKKGEFKSSLFNLSSFLSHQILQTNQHRRDVLGWWEWLSALAIMQNEVLKSELKLPLVKLGVIILLRSNLAHFIKRVAIKL